MSSVFLKVKTIKGAQKLLSAIKHNRRQIPEKNGAKRRIDPLRAYLNTHLTGTTAARQVTSWAREHIKAGGVVKPRRNAILAIELLISLPAGYLGDESEFFAEAMSWCGRQFGGSENILSADVHRDESQPHLHVLVVPLIDGKLAGSAAIGGLGGLFRLHQAFGAQVAARFGFHMLAGRLSSTDKEELAAATIQHLYQMDDPILVNTACLPILDAIRKDPLPFAHAHGLVRAPHLALAQKHGRCNPEIVGKGKRAEREEDRLRRPHPPSRSQQNLQQSQGRVVTDAVADGVAESCMPNEVLLQPPAADQHMGDRCNRRGAEISGDESRHAVVTRDIGVTLQHPRCATEHRPAGSKSITR